MSTTIEVSASQKVAYQRPYKTRSQRREIARRKHGENADQKFLVRMALVVGVLLMVAAGVAMKSWLEPAATTSLTEAVH